MENGPADQDGGLQIQDKVLEVGGVLTQPPSSSSGPLASAGGGEMQPSAPRQSGLGGTWLQMERRSKLKARPHPRWLRKRPRVCLRADESSLTGLPPSILFSPASSPQGQLEGRGKNGAFTTAAVRRSLSGAILRHGNRGRRGRRGLRASPDHRRGSSRAVFSAEQFKQLLARPAGPVQAVDRPGTPRAVWLKLR